jgi:hypothetical protein
LSGTGRSVLGVCTADRPVGCAQLRRQRSRSSCCSRYRKLERHRPLAARRVHR